MPRIICIVAAALASLAMCTQAAVAMPGRDAVGTSSLAGTTSASPKGEASHTGGLLPVGPPTWPVDPEPLGPAPVDVAAPVEGADDTSPLIYVLLAASASILLVAGAGHARRTSRRRTRLST